MRKIPRHITTKPPTTKRFQRPIRETSTPIKVEAIKVPTIPGSNAIPASAGFIPLAIWKNWVKNKGGALSAVPTDIEPKIASRVVR